VSRSFVVLCLICVCSVATSLRAQAPGAAPEAPAGDASAPAATEPSGDANEGADAQAAPASDGADVDRQEEASDQTSDPDLDAAPAYSPEVAQQQRMRELERKLQQAERERDDHSLLLPAALTITGVAALLTGLVAAAAPSITCDDSCSQPFWPSWLAIGGATVGTAGAIWLHHALRDRQELDAKVHGLERDLDYEHVDAAPRAQLTLRVTF
jgi:hypothetical protein